jgi:hypothetical protein
MTPETAAEYDRGRKIADPAVRSMCYATHTNVFFDQRGFAKACCWNRVFAPGQVARQTFDEMWNGPKARELRRAVEAYDFSAGCSFCARQTSDGWPTRVAMENFAHLKASGPDPEWPRRMEFPISSSCDLERIMCSALYSATIRARCETLPPVKNLFDGDHRVAGKISAASASGEVSRWRAVSDQ